MPTLNIRDFSCLNEARVELAQTTVLIGPQASGKSIITKLFYFFNKMISDRFEAIDPAISAAELEERIKREFPVWFPISAWGDGRFSIEYTIGPFKIHVLRDRPYKVPRKTFSVEFSEALLSHLDAMQLAYRELVAARDPQERHRPRVDFRIQFQLEELSRQHFRDACGTDNIESQMFVPAGRAFFTSVGKAIAVFEQSNSLDPVTLDFGRFWASIRDSRYYRGADIFDGDENTHLVSDIFGGRIVRERELEFVQTEDGRRVPFSSLSSGQQELFPLWMAVHYYFNSAVEDEEYRTLMFIEEPEAHLFPSAQSDLIEYLVCRANLSRNTRRMFLTTHSPYVLSKLNNLILAGNIAAKDRSAANKVRRVVRPSAWLSGYSVSAYAIQDRVVSSIIGADGLISAEYLDGVSGCIMDQFSDLLDIGIPVHG